MIHACSQGMTHVVVTHVAGGVLRMRVPSPTLRSQVGALVWVSGLSGHGFGVQGSVGTGLGFRAPWALVWG